MTQPNGLDALAALFKALAGLVVWAFLAFVGLMIVKPEWANKIAEWVS